MNQLPWPRCLNRCLKSDSAMKGATWRVTPPASTTPPTAPIVKAVLPAKVAKISQNITTLLRATDFGLASAAATTSSSRAQMAVSPPIAQSAV